MRIQRQQQQQQQQNGALEAHAQRCTSAERWYGTKYSDQPLDADLAVRWGAARVVPGLALPRAN
eukprot:9168288-Pyramimonas_sp.AAC.1